MTIAEMVAKGYGGRIYKIFLAFIEPKLIKNVLIYTHGHEGKAASLLGISRGTLRKKIKVYRLKKIPRRKRKLNVPPTINSNVIAANDLTVARDKT